MALRTYAAMKISTEAELRNQIVEIGKRLDVKSLVAANDGNISYRLSADRVLVTPTGVPKGSLQADDLTIVDLAGTTTSGGKPTSELPLHLYIYENRPDVKAVVHAHPPYATGFATAGLSLDKCVLAEIIVTIGSVPLARYGTPSTAELPKSLEPFVASCDAFLLANHGVVTVGKDLMDAYHKLERVEHYAQIVFIARALGGEQVLPKEEVKKLYDLRENYGEDSQNPGCYADASNSGYEHEERSDMSPAEFNEIVERVLSAVGGTRTEDLH